MKAISVISESN